MATENQITQITLEDLFNSSNKELLRELLQANKISTSSNEKKIKMAAALVSLCGEKGAKIFLGKLFEKEGLSLKIYNHLNNTQKDASAVKKQNINKYILSEINSHGSNHFFVRLSLELLNQCCELFDFQEASESVSDVANSLEDELISKGAFELFSTMKKEFLQEYATSVDVNSKDSNKQILAYRILEMAFPYFENDLEREELNLKQLRETRKSKKAAAAVEPQEQVPEVPKAPIASGVKATDLQRYNLKELSEFCKANKIRRASDKKTTIKRIVAFVNLTPEQLKAQQEAEPKKKRNKRRLGECYVKTASKKRTKEPSAETSDEPSVKTSPSAKKQKTQ